MQMEPLGADQSTTCSGYEQPVPVPTACHVLGCVLATLVNELMSSLPLWNIYPAGKAVTHVVSMKCGCARVGGVLPELRSGPLTQSRGQGRLAGRNVI